MMASRKTEGGEHADDTGGSDGSVTVGPFSSALSSLFVIHRTLGSSDEAASEAEQYDKVLAYFPGKHSVARQLQLVSFVEGLIDFTARFGEKDNEIVQIVNLKKRCICFYPCEPPDIWLVAVLREPTGLAGDGSDRFNVNGSAVRTLLDLIYRGFVLYHGSISEALASPTKDGPEAMERVKAVRKRIRKNEAKRSLLEGGYDDDEHDERQPDGEKAEAVERNGSLEEKLSALAAAKADLESDLSEALRQSPATRLKRQLHAFLQVYLCGIDFENVHLFENLPAFHMATVDPPLFRKVHGLRHALADAVGQASALAGLCVVLEGQLVGHSGLSQDEMLLTYTYFKLRDFAHMTQQSLPGLPGASSLPDPGPATPSSAARSVEEAAPALDPPQTVAGAFETHRRKTSGIMGKLSGLAQRLKASGVASATSDADTRPEEERAVDSRAPAARGFLAEDGLRYTSTQLQQDGGTTPAGGGPPRLWCPRLHKVGKAADEEARPPRCLLAYATERLLVLVVLRDEGGGGPGLDSRQLAAMAIEVESALGSETASHVPPTERLGSPAPSVTASSSSSSSSNTGASSSSSAASSTSPMELSRFIYHDRVTRSLFTSHPAKSVPGLQAWPPPSLFLCKHRSSVLSPLVLSVLDDFNLQLRDLTWGDKDGQEGPYRELSMRTREDGWIVARQSAGREVYAMVDPRLSSILDAQEALDALLHQCFARVHVP